MLGFLDLMKDNYQWIFSGIGIIFVIPIFTFTKKKILNYLNSIKIKTSLKKTSSIAKYLKITETLKAKEFELNNNSLNIAISNLMDVENSQKNVNKVKCIEGARDIFDEAINSQDYFFDYYDSILLTYYGLALCQYLLKDFKKCRNTLQKYTNLKLKWSSSKQTIVGLRTTAIVASFMALSPVTVPLCKINESRKIDIVDNSVNQINKWILFNLKEKEVLFKQSQDKAVEFAKEIEEIIAQNILQKIFEKKEQILLEKLSKYFNILQNDIIKV